jgi:hypothetical protein
LTLLAVNHHYVSAEPRRGRAIFPTSVQGLRDQVQELARSFEFVSRDDVLAAVEGRRTLPERACLITFDDGLRSQVELGLGVLEELGVPAVFFICGRPLRERRALSVHKIHATREAVSEREFLALVAAEVPEHAARLDELADQAAIVYRYDTPDAACVKYLLNFALEWDTREVVADRIFASVLGDEAAFCEQLYMTAEQVTALIRTPMRRSGCWTRPRCAPTSRRASPCCASSPAACRGWSATPTAPRPRRPWASHAPRRTSASWPVSRWSGHSTTT